MGINRDKLISVQKRLYEIDKVTKAALHTISDILGEGTSSQVSQTTEQHELKPRNIIVTNTGVEFPPIITAQSLGDLVTAKQLSMIRALCRELNLNAEFTCLEITKHATDQLNKLAASSFIQHLQNLQRQGVQ